MRTAAACAEEAGGVRVIDHDQRAMAIGQIADLVELRDRSVHGEHAVGRDQTHARTLRVLQGLLELIHVVVGVAQAPRLAETNAVDDAGVVQGIADDGVLGVEQRFEQAAVRIEAGGVQNRIFHRQIGAQALLQFAMHALRPADEAHRRHAVAIAREPRMRRLEHRRVVGEAQVVVGAQIDHLAPVRQPYHGALRRSDHPLALQEPGRVERLGVARQPLAKFLQHGGLRCVVGPFMALL